MDTRKAIEMIPVLRANKDVLAELIPYAALKRLKKGTLLFLDRCEMNRVYFLAEGAATVYKLTGKQDRKVIFICGAGAMLNGEALDGKPASVYCELLTDAWVLSFETEQFLHACRLDFALTKAVMDSMALTMRRLYRQMINSANVVRIDRKIAAKLWKLSKDHGVHCDSGIRINFNITITFLAELLGAKRETVSRQLKRLTQKGLVLTDRSHFIIPDRDALKKYFHET